MTADSERLPPPESPTDFESLCLDLWQDIWRDPGAQKNGRSGQPQAGVDVFGSCDGRRMGVQCKQKSGLLHTRLSVAELEAEVGKARGFEPPLDTFIVATSGPADGKIQERARALSAASPPDGPGFAVEVWSWEKIWHELYARQELLRRLRPIYWPRLTSTGQPRRAPTRLTHTAATLLGRDEELAWLDAAWDDPGIHGVSLVAWGGVGKTSLVAKWAARLAADGGGRFAGADYFDWSFYSQGVREGGAQGGAASGDVFIAKALTFFGDPEMAASPASPHDKGARLAELVGRRRALLVLDGLEPLQYPPGPLAGKLTDPAIAALLKGLAMTNAGLCVLTTRVPVEDLAPFRDGTTPERPLGKLSTPAGVALLEGLGVHGPGEALAELVNDVDGHALTLHLLGGYLDRAHGGDVRRRDRVELSKADREIQGGHAFKTMAAYEAWLGESGERGARQLAVLRLLGLFDRPASRGCLEALRREPTLPGLTEPLVGLHADDWNLTLAELARHTLVIRLDDPHGELATLDAHPLIREYFARQLEEHAKATWRTAHGRLFDHLRETAEHQPATLEALQPLYQAVAHGCRAGREQEACDEVYHARILRGTGIGGFYSWKILGANGADLGAVACFFEQPWSRVSSALAEADRAWLLSEAALRLRALGRLGEALEPMRAGLEMRIEQENWKQAAISANNLSELELTLGEVAGAVGDAERAVGFADRSGDAFQRYARRTTLGDALHQAGRRDEALERFRQAEAMQAEEQPDYPLLYSLRGFQYCDLLLAEAERVAWRLGLGAAPVDGARSRGDADAAGGLRLCEEVSGRASTALKIVLGGSRNLLDISLNHLTLGRAGLYGSLLGRGTWGGEAAAVAGSGEAVSFENMAEVREQIEAAVEGLRRAGHAEFVARGLLTRAWLRFLLGDAPGAQADLDEAWAIAEAGPMPLFMAEIQLYRARLFHDRTALAEARRLIEAHGYGRRLGELEDADAVVGGW